MCIFGKNKMKFMTRFSTFLSLFLVLSLPLYAQESKKQSKEQEEVDLHEVLKRGDYSTIDTWYKQLPKRTQNSANALALATISATNSFDLSRASELMKAYNKLRIREEKEEKKRTSIEKHLEKVTRMLSNLRTVITHEVTKAPLSELITLLHSQSDYLGTTTASSYTSPDGKLKWEIALGSDSLPGFKVIHKLADGVWDEKNAISVSIIGLPIGATISHPFLLSDGSTLYFSIEQEGLTPSHNLGGKDIYVSMYDRSSNTLLLPTQLPLPFNSPVDDIYYRIDEEADLGWIISSRGGNTDTLTLYTFSPLSLQRYEGVEQQRVAKWDNPTLTPRAKAPSNRHKVSGEKATPYFWIGNQAITSIDDLPQGRARSSFTKYLQLQQMFTELSIAIEKERAQLIAQPSLGKNPQRREQILSMEKRIEELRLQLQAQRNEVIRLSKPSN